VHRDIKPENILIANPVKQGPITIKLADFGVAKKLGTESRETIFTTTLCGTPSCKFLSSHYLIKGLACSLNPDVAPEILSSSRYRRYGPLVDIWSCGVVLYICLCGFPPFSDELYSREFPFTLAQQIKSARFDYPSPYWDSIGDPALDLIDSMLMVDVEKRYTAEQCLEHPWTRDQPLRGISQPSKGAPRIKGVSPAFKPTFLDSRDNP
jgi:serine/threonine-protein kinase CHEK2